MTTRKLYSVDIAMFATAYVLADSENEALAIVGGMEGDSLEFEGPGIDGSEFPRTIENLVRDGRAWALGPAMIIGKVMQPHADLVHEEDTACPF